jgi:hypothetical protein
VVVISGEWWGSGACAGASYSGRYYPPCKIDTAVGEQDETVGEQDENLERSHRCHDFPPCKIELAFVWQDDVVGTSKYFNFQDY